ncbi:hypothetical protein LU290_07560 [Moraxella nasibovis]|uniref:hypothetical protein n=1 Tax=Moraxella nasibovis TaxID=2904120 RepID=UPI00240EF9B6|nr:hypothetical protein [Moraxella nasibovis]WFF38111.1 hypothetical protein LU290_07560 [Moraxella nasibovis]
MIIEFATLPPAVQAWVKTLPAQGDIHFVKENDNLIIEEPLFDIERMQQAIKGCESKEEALKNGTPIPKGLASDFEAFDKWMKSHASSNV